MNVEQIECRKAMRDMQEVFEKIIDESKNIIKRPCGEEN